MNITGTAHGAQSSIHYRGFPLCIFYQSILASLEIKSFILLSCYLITSLEFEFTNCIHTLSVVKNVLADHDNVPAG